MAGKWLPVEVAGAVFVYDGDVPWVLGVPQGDPVFVVPADDGIFEAWVEAERACAAHNRVVEALAAWEQAERESEMAPGEVLAQLAVDREEIAHGSARNGTEPGGIE